MSKIHLTHNKEVAVAIVLFVVFLLLVVFNGIILFPGVQTVFRSSATPVHSSPIDAPVVNEAIQLISE